MEYLTQGWAKPRPLFPKSSPFFQFTKRARETYLLPPSYTPVSTMY